MTARDTFARVGISGALFVAICVAAWFVPLLDVVGYEYSIMVGILVSTVGMMRATERASVLEPSDGRCRWMLAGRLAGDLAVWVAVATALGFLNAVRVRNCDPAIGLAYMGVFGLGAIPVAVATALVLAHFRRPWLRFAAAGLLLLTSLASTAATLALQPAIVAYDTFFGYYAGSIYDESLVGFATHGVYRLWSLATAALVVGLVEFRRTHTRRDVAIVGVSVVVLSVLFCVRGPTGLERDRNYVVRTLGGYAQTEHFDIYYEATAFDARRLALLVADHEARFAELAEFWGEAPSERLRSFVYGSRDSKGALMGGRSTLVAKIWLGEMHITWGGLGDELLAHEMAHLFLREDGRGPLRLASANGLVPIMALVEGAATAAAWGAHDLDYHHWSAALHRLDLAEDIGELLGPAGFWGRYSRRAYTLTGSFVRWLVDTHGPEAFRRAYGRGDFDSAYGESLNELVAQWEEFLDDIPLTDAQLEVARYRYDRPSLFGRLCARSIATRFEDGEEFMVRRDRAAAARCFESIADDDPDNVSYRLRIARAYLRMGDTESAGRHAAFVADADGAGLAAGLRASELLADIDWRAGRHAAALVRYDTLALRAGVPGDVRRIQAKQRALADRSVRPLTEAAVREYLAAGGDRSTASSVAELLVAFDLEGSDLAAYLAVLRVGASDASPAVPLLVDRIDQGALTPEQRLRLSVLMANHWSALGDRDQACRAWAGLAGVAPAGSEPAATAEMWLGRCGRGTLPPPVDPVP